MIVDLGDILMMMMMMNFKLNLDGEQSETNLIEQVKNGPKESKKDEIKSEENELILDNATTSSLTNPYIYNLQ